MVLSFGLGNDDRAQSLLNKVSLARTDVEEVSPPELRPERSIQLEILGKIKTAIEQYQDMWSIQRFGMGEHLKLYEEVLHATSWLAFNIGMTKARLSGIDNDDIKGKINQHVRNVVEGLDIVLRGIPMPGEGLDKTYDPQGIEDSLFKSFK
ncbi:hypothetical protein FRC00_005293, partial [Tulasnella sp. 408]